MRIRTRPAARAGFTLVELLFVLMIILVLIALSAGAILKFLDTGPYSATVANMRKIKAAVDTQWKAIRDKAYNDPLPTDPNELTQLKALAGAPPTATLADPRLRPKYIDLRLAQAFPTSFVEVFNPCNVPPASLPFAPVKPWQGYVNYLATLNVTVANVGSVTNSPQEQQAICLLMALEHGPLHTGQSADALGISAVQRVIVGVTSPSPMQAAASGCADAWGRPLLFTNRANGPAPAAMAPAMLSFGKDGKFGGTWTPNPDFGNDDISTLNY